MPTPDLIDQFLARFEQFLASFIAAATTDSPFPAHTPADPSPSPSNSSPLPESPVASLPPAIQSYSSAPGQSSQFNSTPVLPGQPSASVPESSIQNSESLSHLLAQWLASSLPTSLPASVISTAAGDPSAANAVPSSASVAGGPSPSIASSTSTATAASASIASTDRLIEIASQAIDHLSTISATLDRIQIRLDSLTDQPTTAIFS